MAATALTVQTITTAGAAEAHVAANADGNYVQDNDGNIYLDLSINKETRQAISEIKKLGVVGYYCSANDVWCRGLECSDRKACNLLNGSLCKPVLIIDIEAIMEAIK